MANFCASLIGKEKYAAPVSAAVVCLFMVFFLQSSLVLLQASCIRLAGMFLFGIARLSGFQHLKRATKFPNLKLQSK